ncbi:MAG: glycosyltransferase [Pseudomonadota bacterium]
MRIWQVVSSLGSGGAEVFAADLAIALAEAGQDSGMAVLSEAAAMGDASGMESANRARLEAAGVTVEMIGHSARRRVLPAAWRLGRVLRAARPDLVHCHLKIGLLMLAAWRGPVVATHHTTPLHRPHWLMRLLSRRARAYIGISEQAVANLRSVSTCPVHLIRNGIDFRRLSGSDAPVALGQGVSVLSLGNLRLAKNYPHLVEIAARTGPDLSFHIAGEGDQRPAIEARIAALEMQGRVTLLGARSDAAALLAGADVYLLTSSWEGMPIALLEALHAGLPVIASDVGGVPEILGRDGRAACLVAPEDTQGFADALDALAADPARRAAMGAAARARAAAFSITTTAEAHLALYRSVLA